MPTALRSGFRRLNPLARFGVTARWLGAAALGALATALVSSGCAREQPTRFSVENARAHVDMLAGTIGIRPAGSSNNAKARAYLIDQLRLYGFDVRVQEADAVRAELGLTARVANIIASKAGARPDAIGLVAHYDSVPQAPGALDDALGVAVCLEAARMLGAQASRTHSLMVILTDGEELGLMGAAAAVTDSDVKGRLRAYLNVEAIGASGQSILFEAGPRSAPLLEAWAKAAPRPRGSGYTTEIYYRLPNDTDFSIFRRQDIPGLNFAPVLDSYPYHTSRDTPDRLQTTTIRHTGESIVATAEALDRLDLTATGRGDAAYFDVASRVAFVYAPFWGRVLTIVAALLAVVAWVRLLRDVGGHGLLRALVSFLWALLTIAAAIGAMLGMAWLIRASREVFHPWYAHPLRLLAALIAAGITVPWYVTRLMHLLPERAQSLRTPAAVWALTLPVWAALAIAMEYLAPAAAHLWSIPLLAASLLLAIVPLRVVPVVRIASLLIAIVCALFWLRDGLVLFSFAVTLFGRLPVVTPIWIYPAFLAFLGVMLAPPIVALLTGAIRGRLQQMLVSGVLLLGVAASTGLAYTADAYTADRPLRRAARYVHDMPLGRAWWEVGGNEPGLDLNLPSADAARWRPQTRGDAARPNTGAATQGGAAPSAAAPTAGAPGATPGAGAPVERGDAAPGTSAPATTTSAAAPAMPVSTLVPRLNAPFVFRTDAPLAGPPVDVAATFTTRDGSTELEITLVPRQESLTASVVLPAGLEPTHANLAGRRGPQTGRWTATFAAIPSSGIAFRASVPAALAARLSETLVTVIANRAPDPDQPRVPAWLPQERTEWAVHSRWIVQPPLAPRATPAAPEPPAPDPTGSGPPRLDPLR